jgi:hypothetical protein
MYATLREMKTAFVFGTAVALCFAFASGCAPSDDEDESIEEALIEESGPLNPTGTATQVWKVTRKWSDINPATGLTYEKDYSAWVASLPLVDGFRYGKTLEINTPKGAPYTRKLSAPTLECADTALFLRVTYASLFHLPFYVRSGNIYAGHFGIINRDGTRHELGSNFGSFSDSEATWKPGSPWPSDAKLRNKRAAYSSGDNTFIELAAGKPGGAGAWFDEFFLNKRVGHFMVTLVNLFGSVNLAQEGNMYHVKPEATQPGDVVLHRHGKYSPIGHAVVVYQSRVVIPNVRMQIEAVSGSMPARQAVHEPANQARNYFTAEDSGGDKIIEECKTGYNRQWGTDVCKKQIDSVTKALSAACPAGYEENSWDKTLCMKYATLPTEKTDIRTLGGGIRRFRTPVLRRGRWLNIVEKGAQSVYISDTNLEEVGKRVKRFEELLALGNPAEQRDAAIASIQSARDYLKQAPSSCSKRTVREEAFEALYKAMAELGERDRAAVDAKYRSFEDRVFAELDYDTSKTCCWNSTKPEHYEAIIGWANEEVKKAEMKGMCAEPPVFRATGTGDGYASVRDYAKRNNLAFPEAWSEDETCKAKEVTEDSLTERATATRKCK